MSSKTLQISDERILAEFVRQEEFKSFFEKRLEVPPYYMGLLMKNGQFVEAYKGAHFSVNGLVDKFKAIFGGSTAVSLLLADLRSFQGVISLGGITKDSLAIKGDVVIELQVNPEKPQNILGLMAGTKPLSKADVVNRLSPHLPARVFETAIARVDANELRGNAGLQAMIQADVMKQIEEIAGDLGVLVRSVSVNFAINDVEKAEMARAAALRAAEQAEFDFETTKRTMEREHESTLIKLEAKHELDKLDLANPHELERLVLSQELAFVDARETGVRLQEMKTLQHEIEMIRAERAHKFSEAITKATHEGVDLQVVENRKRALEHEARMLAMEHKLRLDGMQRDYDDETRLKKKKGDLGEAEIQSDIDDINRNTKGKNAKQEWEAAQLKLKEEEERGRVAAQKIAELQKIEIEMLKLRHAQKQDAESDARRHELEMQKMKLNSEIDKIQVSGKLSADQILAMNAVNPAVAKVLEEQAKAKAADIGEREKLLREMVAMAKDQNVATAAQAKAMFETGIQGAVGAAAAAASKPVPASVAGLASQVEGGSTVDCPKCGRTQDAKVRFCQGCGEQLRK